MAEQIAEFRQAGLLRTAYRSILLTDPKGRMLTLTTETEFDLGELLNGNAGAF